MEVRTGYKQTEVGVIPEDWEVVPMGSLGAFTKGQGIRKDEAASGDILCVRYGEIYTHHNDIIRSFNSRISADVAKLSKRLKKGDLLFAGSGETKEEIGKCVAFVGCEEVYAGGDIVILSPSKGNSTFFGYLFNAPVVVRQKASQGQGDAVVHISANALSSVKLPLPPTRAEQEAIAGALSDADALIESLEQLLAKKRHLKQGAMQELLTGKKRLPGFEVHPGYKQTEVGVIPEDWDDKALGDSCDLITKGTTPTSLGRAFVKTGIKFLKAETLSETGEIISEKLAYIDGATHALLGRSQLVGGDLLISIAGVLGRVGRMAEADIPANINQALAIVRLGRQSRVDRHYLFHSLRSSVISNQIRNINVQAAQANISLQNVRDFRLPLPPAKAEQEAIAAILSDMDEEIAALEAKVAKARQIKQGMMQELLTGRIRLV